MKTPVALSSLLLLALVACSNEPARPASEAPAPGGWLTSFGDAVAAARSENKLILANFHGSDWCSWCKKLQHEVFDKSEFNAWAAQHAVLLSVDFPRWTRQPDDLKAQNQSLQSRYGIRSYPTVVFIDPNGKSRGSLGYMDGGPSVWVPAADKITSAYHP